MKKGRRNGVKVVFGSLFDQISSQSQSEKQEAKSRRNKKDNVSVPFLRRRVRTDEWA